MKKLNKQALGLVQMDNNMMQECLGGTFGASMNIPYWLYITYLKNKHILLLRSLFSNQ